MRTEEVFLRHAEMPYAAEAAVGPPAWELNLHRIPAESVSTYEPLRPMRTISPRSNCDL
jgi:hypothetical protein